MILAQHFCSLIKLVQGTGKLCTCCQREKCNKKWSDYCLLPVSNWSIIMIGPCGFSVSILPPICNPRFSVMDGIAKNAKNNYTWMWEIFWNGHLEIQEHHGWTQICEWKTNDLFIQLGC
jgi:hypothetical protein